MGRWSAWPCRPQVLPQTNRPGMDPLFDRPWRRDRPEERTLSITASSALRCTPHPPLHSGGCPKHPMAKQWALQLEDVWA